MKKLYGLIGALALLVGLFGIGIVHSANTCTNSDIMCFVSGPSQNTSTNFRVDASGNITSAGNFTNTGKITSTGTSASTIGGSILQGTSGVAPSTAPTSGNSLGIMTPVLLANGSANAAVEGSVLISSTAISNQVTVVVSTGAGHINVVGIAAAVASTGSVVNMYTSGFVLALTTQTVNAGDVLVTTTTPAGYLVSAGQAGGVALATGNDVGVAMGAGVAAGGLTKIWLRK
jgi:hypothetical protein